MANDKNPYDGKNITPAGILSPDTAAKHGLTKSMYIAEDPSFKRSYRGNRRVKTLFQSVKNYRQFVHNVQAPHLSNSLRLGVHYFLEPMARSSGYISQAPVTDNDNSTAAVQAPLKV